MRLIEPNELEKVLRPILTDESCPLHIAAEIDMNLDLMPKVDAVPVRHGRWIHHDSNDNHVPPYDECSQCGWKARIGLNFCPHCGTKNRKDSDHHE